MTLNELNQLPPAEAATALQSCCGAECWVAYVLGGAPFRTAEQVAQRATAAWYDHCGEDDWREAFTHHPKIGDLESLRKKFAATSHLAGTEQSGVARAGEHVLRALADGNDRYEKQNGFIFIVCATGKSATGMERLLRDRLANSPEEELLVAMGEQHKITLLRLQKLLPDEDWSFLRTGQLTTHVLDTSAGRPGADITIRLQAPAGTGWRTIAQGVTNADGRIPDLLPPGGKLAPGPYRVAFDTGAYFKAQGITGFYPSVEIQFTVFDGSHYHVPLLINPFGYSTYRGS